MELSLIIEGQTGDTCEFPLHSVGVEGVLCQHNAHEDTEMFAVLGERVAPLVA